MDHSTRPYPPYGTASKRTDQACSSDYWHSPAAVRLLARENGQALEYVWRDSVRNVLVTRIRDGQKEFAGNKNAFPSPYLHRGDGWVRALLVINVPGTSQSLPLERLVQAAAAEKKVWRHQLESREAITVRLTFDKSSDRDTPWCADIVLDSAVNYLVRKVTHYRGKSPDRSDVRKEEEVVGFVEVQPGLYFPARVEGKFGPVGKPDRGTSTAVISNHKVNITYPAGAFDLRYPHGVVVTDTITDTAYRVDSSGNPISRGTPLGVHPPPPMASRTDSSAPDPVETKVEPRSRTNLWVISSSVAGLVAAVFVMWRRRRPVS